ncbi:hypothetical protein HNR44_002249 [Geomicrobium halophilum]|uniref:Uncharacterized protein n=1 Tax=Geomicrobium halophilum TaxID=549000 RepID=A0A841PSU6_9BACL|nr:hypothetical protein [Geomicrobium halophilum]MBB6450266.1 hypothetical protein [Geomicrobium halophilum]
MQPDGFHKKLLTLLEIYDLIVKITLWIARADKIFLYLSIIKKIINKYAKSHVSFVKSHLESWKERDAHRLYIDRLEGEKMNSTRMFWILSTLVVSIFFLFYGIITSTEITGMIAQVLGFCGIVFSCLYSLLINHRGRTKKYSEEEKLQS